MHQIVVACYCMILVIGYIVKLANKHASQPSRLIFTHAPQATTHCFGKTALKTLSVHYAHDHSTWHFILYYTTTSKQCVSMILLLFHDYMLLFVILIMKVTLLCRV